MASINQHSIFKSMDMAEISEQVSNSSTSPLRSDRLRPHWMLLNCLVETNQRWINSRPTSLTSTRYWFDTASVVFWLFGFAMFWWSPMRSGSLWGTHVSQIAVNRWAFPSRRFNFPCRWLPDISSTFWFSRRPSLCTRLPRAAILVTASDCHPKIIMTEWGFRQPLCTYRLIWARSDCHPIQAIHEHHHKFPVWPFMSILPQIEHSYTTQ